jgi:hypothetical protein
VILQFIYGLLSDAAIAFEGRKDEIYSYVLGLFNDVTIAKTKSCRQNNGSDATVGSSETSEWLTHTRKIFNPFFINGLNIPFNPCLFAAHGFLKIIICGSDVQPCNTTLNDGIIHEY